jgi:hypothetical protein
VLTEARVVLPGAQALLGFQLVIVLTEAFERLPKESKFVHVLALSLVAIATFLLIAPAAHHRIVFGGEDTPLFHRRASWMLLLSTVALALGIAADAYVVTAKIAASRMIGVGAASASAFFLIGLWHVWPALQRARRRTLHPLKEAPAASLD